jgi:transposase
MPRFIGCDIHKKQVTVCVLDEEGRGVGQHRIACTREALVRFAEEHLEPRDALALEATTHTWAVVELLEPFVARLVVSNPLRTRAIAAAKIKTDRIDARVLADLLRAGYLPEVWQPDAATRRLRGLTHRRAGLVADRTGLKNRIHATLAMRLIPVPWAKLFSEKGLAWMAQLDLDPDGRQALDSDLRLLEALEAEIRQLDDRLAELAYPEEAVRLLMTLPGIDFTVAQAMLAAWGPIERFPDADHAASYLGLVPSTRQSDTACYHGPITKQGNAHARWLLVQAAQHLDGHPGPLGVAFRRLMKKKNRNVAVVAVARKMAVTAYHMLKNREPYRYAVPLSTQTKLARLRVRATGKRRRRGTPAGTPRSDRYGTGESVRTVPSLQQVCVAEELPPPTPLEELAPGERRHLLRTRSLDHAHQVQQPQQRARSTAKRVEDPSLTTS